VDRAAVAVLDQREVARGQGAAETRVRSMPLLKTIFKVTSRRIENDFQSR
jgi:hypothetical protein